MRPDIATKGWVRDQIVELKYERIQEERLEAEKKLQRLWCWSWAGVAFVWGLIIGLVIDSAIYHHH